MKKIGIFTYTIPHRKTIDIFARLLVAGFDREDIFFIAFPYTSKKRNPLYEHRPQNLYDCRYQIDYFMERNDPIPNCDIYLIGGAGIIPSHIIEGRKIINSHPGYLPNVRGLDALKWAIYEGQPIGVTTHLIDAEPDQGQLIDRKITPIYHTDTFHSIARRVYEMELDMMINAISQTPQDVFLKDDRYPPHRRMTHREEIVMMSRCNELIRRQS